MRRINNLQNLITAEEQPKNVLDNLEESDDIPLTKNLTPREELLGKDSKFII